MRHSAIDWDSLPYGVLSDADIAQGIGRTRERVRQQREARGIARHKPRSLAEYIADEPSIDWSMSNKEIAKFLAQEFSLRAGIKPLAKLAARAREIRGLPPSRHVGNPRYYADEELKAFDWTKSNTALAKEHGVALPTIAEWRIRAGAPPSPAPQGRQEPGPILISEEEFAKIDWTQTNAALARRYDVSQTTALKWRRIAVRRKARSGK